MALLQLGLAVGPSALHASPQPLDRRDDRRDDRRNAAAFARWQAAVGDSAKAVDEADAADAAEASVEAFAAHLREHRLDHVAPLHELLRTASDWRTARCRAAGAPPFEVPPRHLWPNLVRTLSLLDLLRREDLLPPVAIVSAYRNPTVEACAHGSGDHHPQAGALDVVPLRRAALSARLPALCAFWRAHGPHWQMGLGLYGSGRVHLDTLGHSTWGHDLTARTSPCRRHVHLADD